jgi:hypothetical protein
MSIITQKDNLPGREDLEYITRKNISKNEYYNIVDKINIISETIKKNPSIVSGLISETETYPIPSTGSQVRHRPRSKLLTLPVASSTPTVTPVTLSSPTATTTAHPSGLPASGLPASGLPASGLPASGTLSSPTTTAQPSVTPGYSLFNILSTQPPIPTRSPPPIPTTQQIIQHSSVPPELLLQIKQGPKLTISQPATTQQIIQPSSVPPGKQELISQIIQGVKLKPSSQFKVVPPTKKNLAEKSFIDTKNSLRSTKQQKSFHRPETSDKKQVDSFIEFARANANARKNVLIHGNDDDWDKKYLKYKNKYLKLKQKLHQTETDNL